MSTDRSPADRMTVPIVACAAAVALGLCLALSALGAPSAVAEEAVVQEQAFDAVSIGGVTPGSADMNLPVQGRTFFSVRDALADRTAAQRTMTIPLPSVLGTVDVTLGDVDLVVDEERFQVVLRGSTTETVAGLGDDFDVLFVADWVAGASDDPSFVVSLIGEGSTVGDLLGLEPGENFAADIVSTGVMYTVGSSSVDPENDIEQENIKYADNLTPLAVEYYESVYGGDGLPTVVPPLDDLATRTHLSVSVDLDSLGDLPRSVFGFGDGGTAVFEGGIGVGLAQVSEFNPRQGGWSLGVVLPRVDFEQSPMIPQFLDLDPTARFTASIAYGEDATVTEHEIDPDDAASLPAPGTEPPAPERVVRLEIAGDMTTDFFGETKEYSVEFQVAHPLDRPGDVIVTVDVEAGEVWDQPFGIDFVSIGEAELEGVISRTTPAGGGEPEMSLDLLVRGTAQLAGKEFEAQLTGAFEADDIDATLVLGLNDTISIGDVLDVLGADSAALPDTLTNPSFGPAGIEIQVSRTSPDDGDGDTSTTTGSTTTTTAPTSTTVPGGGSQLTVKATAVGTFQFELPHGGTIGAKAMISIDSTKDANGKKGVTFGVRSTGALTLNDILPGSVETPFDIDLVDEANGSTVGFLFTTRAIATQLDNEPRFLREFYRPLYGRAPDDARPLEVILPVGASALGSLELPEDVADVVGTLGTQSRVSVRGTLPVFSSSDTLSLELGLSLASEGLPDFIDQVTGGIKVDLANGASGPRLRMGLVGDLRLRLPAGLPAEVADPLTAAGIPVETFDDVAEGSRCGNGSMPLASGDAFRCYDLVSLRLDAGIAFSPTGGVSLDIAGSVTTPRPGNLYHPFGLEWLGIDDARLRLAIGVDGDGNISITPGIQGDVQIGQTDLLAAVELDIELLTSAPYALVELNGIRVASGAGIDLQDFFDIQHSIASVAARAIGQPDPPTFDLDDMPIPNLALRNLEFSFSPRGVPTLCIPQGLVLSGDFYIAPSGSEPVNDPSCENGTSVIPDPDDRCNNRRDDGCLASGRLRISNNGFEGLAQLSGFDVGPVHLEDVSLDVAVTLADQHVRLSGHGRVDNPLGGSAPLVSGDLVIEFGKDGALIYGATQILDLQALIEIEADLVAFSELDPSFTMHAVLASDQTSMSSPSLVDGLNEILNVPLRTLAGSIVIGHDILMDYEQDGIIAAIERLPRNLQNIGVPVPDWVLDFIDEMGPFIDAVEAIETFIFDAVDFGWDVFMNGIEPFGFDGVEVCIIKCFDIIPSFEFPGIPGLCDEIFPESTFPGLRDSSGDCRRDRVIRGIVFPMIEDVIESATGSNIDLTELIDELGGTLATGGRLLELECAEYFLQLDSSAQQTSLAVTGQVLGNPFGIEVGVDFADPLGSIGTIFEDLVDQLLNPGSVTCAGPNPDIFDTAESSIALTTADLVAVSRPSSAREGEAVTLEGVVQVPSDRPDAFMASHLLTIDWGDGTVTSLDPIIVSGVGETVPFTATHTYADDALGENGLLSVTVEDAATVWSLDGPPVGLTDQAGTTVVLRNAPPVIGGELLGDAKEHDVYSIDLQISDPGNDDLTVLITWGDGRTEEHHFPATGDGAQSHRLRADHVFEGIADGEGSGAFDVAVLVVDGEGGRDQVSRRVIVENVPPNILEVTGPEVTSSALVDFELSLDETTSYILCGVGETAPAVEDMAACGFVNRIAFLGQASYGFHRPADWDEELFAQTFWFRGVDLDGAVGDAVSFESILDTTPPDPPELNMSGDFYLGGSDEEPIAYTALDAPSFGYVAYTELRHPSDSQNPDETSPNYRVTDFECRVDTLDIPCDGSFLGAVRLPDGRTVWQSSGIVEIGGMDEGPHNVQVRAMDASGNWSDWTQHLIIVDRTGPNTAFASTPPATGGHSGSFQLDSDDPSSYVPGYPGPVDFECWFATQTAAGAAGFEPDWQGCGSGPVFDVAANTGYAMGARAIDGLGNVGVPIEYEWETGHLPVTVAFDQAPPETTGATSAQFAWHTDGGSIDPPAQLTTEVFLDGNALPDTTQPLIVEGLAAGVHSFEVRVTDSAVEPAEVASATHHWFVDLAPGGPNGLPRTRLTEAPAGAELQRNWAEFEFFGIRPEGTPDTVPAPDTFRCVLLDGRHDPTVDDLTDDCSSPVRYDDLADGEYTFAVSAIYPDGRIDLSPEVWVFTLDTYTMPTPTLNFTETPPAVNPGLGTFAWESQHYPDDVVERCSIRVPDVTLPMGFSDVFPNGYRVVDVEDCASPHDMDVTNRGGGRRSFNVSVFAADGATLLDRIEYPFTVDADHPETAIDSGGSDAVNVDSRTFEFSSSATPATFRCGLLDGAASVSVDDLTDTCESPMTFDGLADGSYTFAVTSADAAGRVDPTPATLVFDVASTEPSASFTEAPLPRTEAEDFTFAWETRNYPPGTVATCALDVNLDASEPTGVPCESPTDISIRDREWHVSGQGAARITFTVAFSTADGDPINHIDYVFTFGETQQDPDTYMISGPEGAPDAPSTDPAPVFEFASDNPDATFECRILGGEWESCTSPYTYDASRSEATLRFEARAVDEFGADFTPAQHTWTMDTQAPFVIVMMTPPDLSYATTATFAVRAESGSTFECSLDAAPWAQCSGGVVSGEAQDVLVTTMADLQPGDHSFRVRAIDEFGHVGPAYSDGSPPVPLDGDDRYREYTWTIDLDTPDTEITGFPLGTVGGSAEFEFTSDDPEATFECRIGSEQWTACESPTTQSGFGPGDHTFEVRARNANDMVDPTPASFEFTSEGAPPVVSITDAPEGFVTSASAQVAFGVDDPDADVTCRLDDGTRVACASPVTFDGLDDGEHTVRIRATDADGLTGPVASATWTVDTTAPTVTIDDAPTSPSPDATASFTLSSDDPSATFRCRLDGGAVEACDAAAVFPDLAEGDHDLRVWARDAAGNSSAPALHVWTIEIDDTPPVDETPPVATITSAPTGTVTDTGATVAFVSDEENVTFECVVDDDAWTSCTSPLELADLDPGPHTVQVRGTDAAGNVSEIVSASWTVEEVVTELVVTIDSRPPALDVSADATVEFSAEGAVGFECRLDDGEFAGCTSPATYSELLDGPHTFSVRALGEVDVVSNVASATWTVDTTPPSVSITDSPASPTNATAASIDFDVTEAGNHTTECRLDGGDWASCASPYSASDLIDGAHRLEVRATDEAGHVSDVGVAEWTVDTVAPTVEIDESQAPDAETTATEATFVFHADDGSGVNFFRAPAQQSGRLSIVCSLDDDVSVPCTSPVAYTDLAVGAHTFLVTAIDAAGNSTSASYSWRVLAPSTTTTTSPGQSTTITTTGGDTSSTTAATSTSPGSGGGTATAGPSGEPLPRTGGDARDPASTGLTLIALGAALCVVALGVRRRFDRRRL